MAAMTIAELDEALAARLQARAARHGRTVEDEARDILESALADDPRGSADLGASIRARFAALGGLDLPETKREPPREPGSVES